MDNQEYFQMPVYVAVKRKGITYHSVEGWDSGHTTCGRSTRTGWIVMYGLAKEYRAIPCRTCLNALPRSA
jgi:hypothetical protein